MKPEEQWTTRKVTRIECPKCQYDKGTEDEDGTVRCQFCNEVIVEKGKSTIVSELPKCDFCSEEAHYDGKTTMGSWANMCHTHFKTLGIGLGVGRGQLLAIKAD